ncbi:alpha/beta hydrolase [Ramlibacter pallidus]|uniref:Alpha/beta fold hydrolase n=1 Tax=Ramlibacter pallidus TaxID=2780087 RepID=A0ABR9RZE6_9BURK|nr:alpha/beta fold hydrolase [Ramlibacter pallidus]MBE7366625.1 alpha/beta fold hydrolase [Ramlibacter pallidus]
MTSSDIASTSAGLAFGHSRVARWAAAGLRAAHGLAPDLAARLAVHLFFTPFPTKLSTRRRVPPAWRAERLSTGQEGFVLLRHRPTEQADLRRPRVLLVHGWAGDALQMRPLGEAVAAAGFEPVLMDLPAHGRSTGWRCTMPQIVRGLFEAQARCGPFDAIVAHSMGAVAGLHAMAHGLAAGRMVALAASSPPAAVLQWFGDAFGLAPGLLARMRQRIEERERMALEQFGPDLLGARVQVPVLLVHDRGDRMAPVTNSTALANALPAATLRITEGLSHRRILADAQVVEWTLSHLAGREGSDGRAD